MGRNKAWGIICMTTRSFGLHGLVALAKFSQNGNFVKMEVQNIFRIITLYG